jgi:hypothetical protein
VRSCHEPDVANVPVPTAVAASRLATPPGDGGRLGGGGDVTLTLVPHVRHRWTVVQTDTGRVQLSCAKCGRSEAIDKLNRRVHHHMEKMVAHPIQDVS